MSAGTSKVARQRTSARGARSRLPTLLRSIEAGSRRRAIRDGCGDSSLRRYSQATKPHRGCSIATREIPPRLAQLLLEADPATRSKLELRAARAVNACGCSSGAVALLLGSVLSVLWWLTHRDGSFIMWPEVAFAALAVVVATVLAKLAGILFARLWLAWTQSRLEGRLANPSATSK
jgi:hypothetical protein